MLVYNLIERDKLDSTNKFAKEIIAGEFLPEGSIIYAASQQKGRGTGDNKWESQPGKNITLSFVFYPLFLELSKQFVINKVVALAVYDFVLGYLSSSEVKIKWPNDIYVDDKKIAGILIENSIIGNEFQNCIAGIGVNINQEKFVSNAPNPVSLKNITKKDYNIYECIDRLFICMAKRYKMLENEHYDTINDDYINALYRYDKFAEYMVDNKKINARICGIGETGMLRVFTIDNKFLECDFKEISFII